MMMDDGAGEPRAASLLRTATTTYPKTKDAGNSSRRVWIPPFLTPYQLLHPASFFPSSNHEQQQQQGDSIHGDNPTTRKNNNKNPPNNGYEIVGSMHTVLRLLRGSLQQIINAEQESNNNNPASLACLVREQIRRATTSLAQEANNNDNTTSTKLLRIEHRLDPTIVQDALAWLRAQNQQSFFSSSSLPPMFYLQTSGNPHGIEAACVGSVLTIHSTSQLWNASAVPVLPRNTQWYGAARFDEHGMHDSKKDDWKAFGPAYWMIPAVELVRRRRPQQPHRNQHHNNEAYPWEVTLAVHLVSEAHDPLSFARSARQVLSLLESLTSHARTTQAPCTTIPPIVSRHADAPELFEQAVAAALSELDKSTLQKVVLARRQKLELGTTLEPLDVLARWKYTSSATTNATGGGDLMGHLFYLRPASPSIITRDAARTEFFGCTPERLFAVDPQQGVTSEALAGTRPRGTTQEADEQLLRELLQSPKDLRENQLTGEFIARALEKLHAETGWIQLASSSSPSPATALQNQTQHQQPISSFASSGFFVRRLRHVQHICQRYTAQLVQDDDDDDGAKAADRVWKVAEFLLNELHPTPAVCGLPVHSARKFIRQHETQLAFDRGFYAGPLGYVGRDHGSEIVVAIRSALSITPQTNHLSSNINNAPSTTLSTYAGAGLVRGSTLASEWSEINSKFAVLASLFPQSPVTFRGSISANVAWCTAWIEEWVRQGVTRFYVCPGSRSSPLVAAIAKAVRGGIVQAISVHDERAAAFRAVGYARGGRLAAIITSSGTAVANLYPAVVEAGQDGVPLLLLTADRPYEARGTGANQAIDQVKLFGEQYVRWFRDVLPPSDDVPVSVALSDAGHAVHMARNLRGPVHVNLQFRENLAPEAGPIRNDGRVGSFTRFDGLRFTDVPGFARWSNRGGMWRKSYPDGMSNPSYHAVQDIARLIGRSRRGLIVVGNLRSWTSHDYQMDQRTMVQAISDFAKAIGFPILAGAQSATLRFTSSAVVPFAEHLLKCSIVADNLRPDLIIQIGAPLVSTESLSAIVAAMKANESMSHVLVHPHIPTERADPEFTVTHQVSAEIVPFVQEVVEVMQSNDALKSCSSQLAPLVVLGQTLQASMKSIIHEATESAILDHASYGTAPELPTLSEPEIIVALSEAFSQHQEDAIRGSGERSLFLSNSMPIRDAEFFLYPFSNNLVAETAGPKFIGSNRGASGIDGIISSALGFSEATEAATTLLIGDVATLHDIGSLHSVANSAMGHHHPSAPSNGISKHHPLTTVIVNNDGGGIFSFLPIARHSKDVAFEEFFGTPTSSFSFEKGAEAFGLPCRVVSSYESFCQEYSRAAELGRDSIVEARVVNRAMNVAVHQKITRGVECYVKSFLFRKQRSANEPARLPITVYYNGLTKKIFGSDGKALPMGDKTLVLLHGWMGSKMDWNETASILCEKLRSNSGGDRWTIISVDLPGHESSPCHSASSLQALRSALHLDNSETGNTEEDIDFCIDSMAQSVLTSLALHHEIVKIDAIAGYSLGGRVALAMKHLCLSERVKSDVIDSRTAVVLLGSDVGDILNAEQAILLARDNVRMQKDEVLSSEITSLCDKFCLTATGAEARVLADSFLDRWYSAGIWGSSLRQNSELYSSMTEKRSLSLRHRGRDLAKVLYQSSPPRNPRDNWLHCNAETTLFISGSLDKKYSGIGKILDEGHRAKSRIIDGVGHALLVEAPLQVASVIADFLQSDYYSASASTEGLRTVEESGSLSKAEDVAFEGVQQTLTDGPGKIPLWSTRADSSETLDSIQFERFTIGLVDADHKKSSLSGIGWGERAVAKATNMFSSRIGYIIELRCTNGLEVGLGEVSPLPGLHSETLDQVETQLELLRNCLRTKAPEKLPEFEAQDILNLDGALGNLLQNLECCAGLGGFFPSVWSGLEMALISLAAQKIGLPIHQAISRSKQVTCSTIPVSGLITRHSPSRRSQATLSTSFSSVKVKIGHQNPVDDSRAMLQGFQLVEMYQGKLNGRVRADANRAWNESQAIEFATMLEGIDVHAMEKLEFIEEPLKKVLNKAGDWTFADQIAALERSYQHTGIPYAVDESLADLADMSNGSFDSMKKEIEDSFLEGRRGCAVFVFKPTLLGLELSSQLSRFVQTKLGIGAVFSSSFDSGIGLAHTSFLGYISDQTKSTAKKYSHGVGTFTVLSTDTITPPFKSYVNSDGILNIASLSRALYGLSLDEIRELQAFAPPATSRLESGTSEEAYEAATATSSNGNQISVVVSLPLPFSAETACSRFTDLPSMSRWSPWISSVQYQGKETEWTVNVRGIPLKWRAQSEVFDDPSPGIQWQSVSGLMNRGVVEFVADKSSNDPSNNCNMNVRMTIVTPRILRPLFEGTSLFIEEFLRDKLLKWSLEMFRDSVKADLALERGDVELGDALIGAVEGKANAIEATLNSGPAVNGDVDR